MRTEIDLEDCYGKTLERVTFSSRGDQCVLVFADGTFTTLEARHDAWGEYSEINTAKLEMWDFGRTELIQSGICTAEEYETKKAAEDAQLKANIQAQWEQRDRQEYARLKAKYEGGVT